jgi:hypothetical protein
MDYDVYIENFKENPLNKALFAHGVYKTDEDIKSFAVVFESDKLPLRTFMGLPYIVRICLPICERVLKPFSDEEKSTYLTYVMLHELTHIFEGQLIKKHESLWEKSLERVRNDRSLASEEFANNIASLYCRNSDIHEEMEKEIYREMLERLSNR